MYIPISFNVWSLLEERRQSIMKRRVFFLYCGISTTWTVGKWIHLPPLYSIPFHSSIRLFDQSMKVDRIFFIRVINQILIYRIDNIYILLQLGMVLWLVGLEYTTIAKGSLFTTCYPIILVVW